MRRLRLGRAYLLLARGRVPGEEPVVPPVRPGGEIVAFTHHTGVVRRENRTAPTTARTAATAAAAPASAAAADNSQNYATYTLRRPVLFISCGPHYTAVSVEGGQAIQKSIKTPR